MPLVEELGNMPTEKYAKGPELLAHAENIAKKWDLDRRASFQTEIKEMKWNQDLPRWIVSTDRGDELRARFVVTGATAVQIVPHLGKYAKEVYVYQRTPSSLGVRGNKPTDADWFKSLEPGWQKKRHQNFNTIITGGYQEVDLVDDGWTEILKYLSFPGGEAKTDPNTAKIADMKMMNNIRNRVDSIVTDKVTADKLKPWYGQMCKVHLVDTNGKGVERVTERGLVENGQEVELDCIIWATGFDLASDFSIKNGIEITGRNQTLTQKWSDGISTLHGLYSRRFPNAFIIGPSQAAASANFVHSIDEQAKQITYVISVCEKKKYLEIEPCEEAETAWVAGIVAAAPFVREATKDCTPGYYNNEGRPTPQGEKQGTFPGGMDGYLAVFDEWRKGDSLPGMEVTTQQESVLTEHYANHPLEQQPLKATI